MSAWLTEKDLQDYGPDVLDLAQRAALHATAPELQRIDAQNAELRQQLANSRQRLLYQALDSALPNWKEIDNSPRWRQWLLLSDPLNGRPRQSLLNDAIAQGDSGRVLAVFRGFLAEAGRQPQQPQQALSVPTGKRTYTRAQITQASNDYLRGRIPQSEYEQLSADMHRALGEGRIVGPMPLRGVGKTRV